MLRVVAAPERTSGASPRLGRAAAVAALLPPPLAIGALAPLAARGAVRFGKGRRDRPARAAGAAAGGRAAPRCRPPLRRVDARVDPGRPDEVARLAELAAARGRSRWSSCGPDARWCSRGRSGSGLIVVGEPSPDAELAAALEQRVVVYTRWIESRARSCSPKDRSRPTAPCCVTPSARPASASAPRPGASSPGSTTSPRSRRSSGSRSRQIDEAAQVALALRTRPRSGRARGVLSRLGNARASG